MKLTIRGTGHLHALRSGPESVTGMPVYAIDTLPDRPGVSRFAARYRPDRAGLLALYAADDAVARAGWRNKNFAIIVGGSRGPTASWEAAHTKFLANEVLPASTSPRTTLGSLAFTLADYFGQDNWSSGISVTCSSGLHALVQGVALLRAGMAERVLVGGAEAPITPFTLRQLAALGVYAERVCLPFDPSGPGMVIGEGAAFLALERTEKTAGSSILGIGFAREGGRGRSGISAAGQALQRSMRTALGEADLTPDRIIAHAPGTKKGDAAELAAIYAVFTDEVPRLTSFKAMTGHTFGASGPLGMTQGLLRFPGETLLVNATGFGGNAVSVVLGPHP